MPLKILTLTTLYPNAASPNHGVFVENRLRAVRNVMDAEFRVIAPVPWFPSQNDHFGKYARFAQAPLSEMRHGMQIEHPRYFLPPKVGMNYAPQALARCFLKRARQLIADGWDFDLIDAHYLYPDGVAAAEVAKALGKPFLMTARGSDVSLLPNYDRPRRLILNACDHAYAVVTVADALRDELIKIGGSPDKLLTIRNGVDLETFRPIDPALARQPLGVSGKVILSVGHLIERKGHHRVIEALANLPDVTLLIAGDGENERTLKKQATETGVAERVRFLGAVPHEELAAVYSAADALVLASSREGWPNVLLEAMACGTPAVATNVWGAKEVITSPDAGRLAGDADDVRALTQSIREVLAATPARKTTRHYAEYFSWKETAERTADLFRAAGTSKKAA